MTGETDRRHFIDSLLTAIQTVPVTVLLTLRADFFAQAIDLLPELHNMMPQSLVVLGLLHSEEWRTIVEEPAKLLGLQFEPGLVDRMLKDVEAQPDSLPLLEYALTELWERKRGTLITHAQYEDIGGIEGAINKRADEVLARLPPAQQDYALHALTQLVQVSIEQEGVADSRRRVRLVDLEESSRQMLQSFVGARLLMTNHNDITDEDTIEIAHEALIRRWGKLREVLDKDREFLYWRRRLGFRIQEWEIAHHDEGALLHGTLLTEAKRWLVDRYADLTVREREFITWDEHDEYQIAQILSTGISMVHYAPTNSLTMRMITLAVYFNTGRTLEAAHEAKTRAWVLVTIAKARLQAGCLEQVQQVAVEALAAARGIKEAWSRTEVLEALIEPLTAAGYPEQVQQVVAEALEATREIEYEGHRAEVLGALIEPLTAVGYPEQAQQVAVEALAAVRMIRTEDEAPGGVFGEIFRTTAQTLAPAGCAEQVLAAARGIENAEDCAEALRAIAEALAQVGYAEQVQQVAVETLAAVHRIEKESRKYALGALADVFKTVAEALVHAGCLEQALVTARKIEACGKRMKVLGAIAEAFAHVGCMEQMQQVVVEALAAARGTEVWQRAEVLESLAKALSHAGYPEQVQQVAVEALAAARETAAWRRAEVLKTLAEALAHAGCAEQVLEAINGIEKAEFYAEVLGALIEPLVHSGNAEKAWLVADEARNAVKRIYDDKLRSNQCASLAKVLARLQSYRRAREMADLCSSTEDKLEACTAILQAYMLEHNPDLIRLSNPFITVEG